MPSLALGYPNQTKRITIWGALLSKNSFRITWRESQTHCCLYVHICLQGCPSPGPPPMSAAVRSIAPLAGLLGAAEELAANLALDGLAQLEEAAVGAEIHDLAGLQAGDVVVGVAAGELLQAGDTHPDALAGARDQRHAAEHGLVVKVLERQPQAARSDVGLRRGRVLVVGAGDGAARDGRQEALVLQAQHQGQHQLGVRHRRQAQALLGAVLQVRAHVRQVDQRHLAGGVRRRRARSWGGEGRGGGSVLVGCVGGVGVGKECVGGGGGDGCGGGRGRGRGGERGSVGVQKPGYGCFCGSGVRVSTDSAGPSPGFSY